MAKLAENKLDDFKIDSSTELIAYMSELSIPWHYLSVNVMINICHTSYAGL